MYRYGYLDDSSLWRDEGRASRTKVAWFLDQVEDVHGNRMHYYYEEYPGGQDTYRQPVLRAIEYGVPASAQETPARMVVLFDYLESPWKRASHAMGTQTDFAFVLDRGAVRGRRAPLRRVRSTCPPDQRRRDRPGHHRDGGS